MRIATFIVALLSLTLLAAGCEVQTSSSPVSNAVAYNAQRQVARDGNKIFIVKASATWCGPCRQMNATTMADRDVVSWLDTNAVYFELDIDGDPEISRTLDISAVPTIIAFKGDQELDRMVGYANAKEFLSWLGRIEMESR